MGTNESQLGIICGRKDATKTCFTIAREHYLKHMDSRKQCIIITFSDKDLKLLIDEEVNLLEYLEYKIFANNGKLRLQQHLKMFKVQRN